MFSPLGKRFAAGGLWHRAAVALVTLAVTLFVYVVWQKMVCTIPVPSALPFFAAGINAEGGSTRRNPNEGTKDIDAGQGWSDGRAAGGICMTGTEAVSGPG